MLDEPGEPPVGFPPAVIKLNDFDLHILKEACRAGVLKVKIAGKISEADRAREFERCKSATVLRYLGFLEELPDEGAYARWRPVKGCKEALAAVIRERGRT
jgi:hypothetical protein